MDRRTRTTKTLGLKGGDQQARRNTNAFGATSDFIRRTGRRLRCAKTKRVIRRI